MSHAFDAHTTADEVLEGVSLIGKRVFITGVSNGLGAETARALVAKGAVVIGTMRQVDEQRQEVIEIRSEARDGEHLELLALDLGDLASVRAVTDQIVAADEPFDLVIANAGVMATPFSRTTDGFELQFGVNALGHFVLVNRLAPLMRKGARLVMLSSNSHRFADVDLQDPSFERTEYAPWLAYSRAKTACALMAVAFDERHRARGVRAASVHPGLIQTGIGRHLDPTEVEKMMAAVTEERNRQGKPIFEGKSIPQGAATTVWAGVAAPVERIGGQYCEDCDLAEVLEDDAEADLLEGGVRRYALDSGNARAFWTKAEEMVGERF